MSRLTDHSSTASEPEVISLRQSALMMGVSIATIRNWVKAGHLAPVAHRPLLFDAPEVQSMRARIVSGEIVRLRSRANKTGSRARFIPSEYLVSDVDRATILQIIVYVRAGSLDMAAALFCVAMRILELSGEVSRKPEAGSPHISSFHSWRRRTVQTEMVNWHEALEHSVTSLHYELLYQSFHVVAGNDFLGTLYQALNMEGDKSRRGSYYTPVALVIEALMVREGAVSSFLDPCCGTGQYLVHAAAVLGLGLDAIFGFDSDEMAVRISRFNLMLAFRDIDMRPNVERVDMLALGDFSPWPESLASLRAGVDYIATNPPWGADKNLYRVEAFGHPIRSQEVFSLFLAQSIAMLKEGGALSFVLPESILKIRRHADIRELILRQTHIRRIVKLGRVFSGVFTPVIRMDLVKGLPKAGTKIAIEGLNAPCSLDQSRFLSNAHFVFNIHATNVQDRLINKIYARDFITLKGHADWALGIVTGNNAAFIKNQWREGSEPIAKGQDILPFVVRAPRSFIHFEPERLQQTARVELYRASEKLIYKFISKSLVFAYDDQQTLTLNSANILIPRVPGLGIKAVLGFLNSRVFQYLFSRLFWTHKVLRGDLESLPFPRMSAALNSQIEAAVEVLIAGGQDFTPLNALIYRAFDLDGDDICHIETL